MDVVLLDLIKSKMYLQVIKARSLDVWTRVNIYIISITKLRLILIIK